MIEQAADVHEDDIRLLIGALVAVVTGMIGMMTLLVKTLAHSKDAALEAKQANSAVNNTGPGEHRLYDKITNMQADLGILTEAQHDFAEKGWRHLPDDIKDAPRLTSVIRKLQAEDDTISVKLDGIKIILDAHIERELNGDK